MNKAYKKPYTDLKNAVKAYLANTNDSAALATLVSLANTETPTKVASVAKAS